MNQGYNEEATGGSPIPADANGSDASDESVAQTAAIGNALTSRSEVTTHSQLTCAELSAPLVSAPLQTRRLRITLALIVDRIYARSMNDLLTTLIQEALLTAVIPGRLYCPVNPSYSVFHGSISLRE